MKYSLLMIILTSYIFSYCQNPEYDIRLNILKKIFSEYDIKQIEEQTVFETTVWGKHATIPINNCHLVTVNKGTAAMVFEIFLSEDSTDYQKMITLGIENLFIGDGFQGGDERLLQVIFYDTYNDKFIGKGEGFPLGGYPWIQDNINNWSDMTLIIDFSYIPTVHDVCKLTIFENLDNTEGLGGKHYIFKYDYNKIFTSKGIIGCYESIYEKNNSLIIKILTNCEENHFDGEPKQINEQLLFKW